VAGKKWGLPSTLLHRHNSSSSYSLKLQQSFFNALDSQGGRTGNQWVITTASSISKLTKGNCSQTHRNVQSTTTISNSTTTPTTTTLQSLPPQYKIPSLHYNEVKWENSSQLTKLQFEKNTKYVVALTVVYEVYRIVALANHHRMYISRLPIHHLRTWLQN